MVICLMYFDAQTCTSVSNLYKLPYEAFDDDIKIESNTYVLVSLVVLQQFEAQQKSAHDKETGNQHMPTK